MSILSIKQISELKKICEYLYANSVGVLVMFNATDEDVNESFRLRYNAIIADHVFSFTSKKFGDITGRHELWRLLYGMSVSGGQNTCVLFKSKITPIDKLYIARFNWRVATTKDIEVVSNGKERSITFKNEHIRKYSTLQIIPHSVSHMVSIFTLARRRVLDLTIDDKEKHRHAIGRKYFPNFEPDLSGVYSGSFANDKGDVIYLDYSGHLENMMWLDYFGIQSISDYLNTIEGNFQLSKGNWVVKKPITDLLAERSSMYPNLLFHRYYDYWAVVMYMKDVLGNINTVKLVNKWLKIMLDKYPHIVTGPTILDFSK